MFGSVRPLIPQICLQSRKNLLVFFPGKQRVPGDKKQKLRETSETIFFLRLGSTKKQVLYGRLSPCRLWNWKCSSRQVDPTDKPSEGKRKRRRRERERESHTGQTRTFFFFSRGEHSKRRSNATEGKGTVGGGGAGGLNARGRQVSSWDLAPKRNVP